MAAVGIARFASERGRFDFLSHEVNRDRAVRDSCGYDAMKHVDDIFRLGVRGDVPVARRLSQKHVADGTADEICLKSVFFKNIVQFFQNVGNLDGFHGSQYIRN